MSTKIEVDEFVDAAKVCADLTIDPANLQDAFIKQPGYVYFYSTQLARAQRQTASLKLKLEANEAQIAAQIREAARESGEKLTVDGVKEKVRLHPNTIAIEVAAIKAAEVEAMLKGVVAAFRDRRDSLVALGMADRDERRAQVSVMDDATSAREKWEKRLAANS